MSEPLACWGLVLGLGLWFWAFPKGSVARLIRRLPSSYMTIWHAGARQVCYALNRQIQSLKPLDGSLKMLDLGTGPGVVSLAAAQSGAQVYGVDLRLGALSGLQTLIKRLGLSSQIKAVQAPCQALPFAPQSFDFIYCGHIIEHLQDPQSLLDECARVLKKDGLLVIATPSLCSRISLWRLIGFDLEPDDHVVPGYDKKSFQTLIPNQLQLLSSDYESGFLEANLMDSQILMGQITGVKANTLERPLGDLPDQRWLRLMRESLFALIDPLLIWERRLSPAFLPGLGIRFTLKKR